MKPEVLVTGATGFVGGRLAETLLEAGERSRVLVRRPARLSRALAAGCEVICGDLADTDALARAVKDVRTIFHCAANVATWDRFEAYRRVNVTGVENLLEAARLHSPDLQRFVHVSTVDVYGYPKHPCAEEAPTPPSGFGYGDSKREGEDRVRRSGIPYTIVRPANVIGPGSQFVERIGRELARGVMLKVDGGRANGGFIDVDSLVDYLRWAADAPAAVGEIYNARDPYDATWADFVTDLKRAIGGHGRVLDLPFRVADTIARGFECTYAALRIGREPLLHRMLVRIFGRTCGHSAEKIRAASGISPTRDFPEVIARSAEWFRAAVEPRPTHR